jgi:hypothetical protein
MRTLDSIFQLSKLRYFPTYPTYIVGIMCSQLALHLESQHANVLFFPEKRPCQLESSRAQLTAIPRKIGRLPDRRGFNIVKGRQKGQRQSARTDELIPRANEPLNPRIDRVGAWSAIVLSLRPPFCLLRESHEQDDQSCFDIRLMQSREPGDGILTAPDCDLERLRPSSDEDPSRRETGILP